MTEINNSFNNKGVFWPADYYKIPGLFVMLSMNLSSFRPKRNVPWDRIFNTSSPRNPIGCGSKNYLLPVKINLELRSRWLTAISNKCSFLKHNQKCLWKVPTQISIINRLREWVYYTERQKAESKYKKVIFFFQKHMFWHLLKCNFAR